MNKNILLVDYQTTAHYMLTDETRLLQLQKKALNYIQNKRKNRDFFRKTRKNYTNFLLQLGTWLKQHDIGVFYTNVPDDQALYEKNAQTADIVLFWVTTPLYPYILDMVNILKSKYPQKIVIMAGYHASGIPREILSVQKSIDYILIGEMEQSLLQLCNGVHPVKIPGVAGRYENKIFVNNKPILLKNNELPDPDYSLLHGNLQNYKYYLQMTRSCPFRCNYCVYGHFWGKVRYRSLESMKKELIALRKIKGATFEMHFFDNIVALDKKRLKALSNLIDELKMKISFSADIRAEYLQDVETVKLLERLGVKQLFFGFEDITPACREVANRTLDEKILLRSLRLVKENSTISSVCYWMMGLPGTTYNSFKENIKFVKWLIKEELIESICPDTIFVPLPGTPFYNNAESFGIKDLEKDWRKYQRSNYYPVYSLSTISKKEIFEGLVMFDKAVIQAESEILSISVDEAVKEYLTVDGGKCVENFLK